MAGWFPPGPPLILGSLRDFSHPIVGPIGSSQVQQGDHGLDLNCLRIRTFSTLGFPHDPYFP